MANTLGGSTKRTKICYDNDGIKACNEFFSVTNLETNKTEWHQDTTIRLGGTWDLQGPETSTIIGTYDPKTKKFTPNDKALASQAKYFTSPEGTKQISQTTKTTNTKALVENGETPEEAQQKAQEISNGHYAKPDQDDTNTTETDDANNTDEIEGTKSEFATDLMYPISLSKETQDTLIIKMLKYEPRGLNSTKARAGLGDQTRNGKIRTKIGQVILPIPGGIKDSDNVTWGEDSMNSLQMKAAKVAADTITGGLSGFEDAFEDVKLAKGSEKAPQGLRNLISAYFTAAAIGKDFKTIMQRQEGAVLNPNMELLFGGPTLRPFAFNFLLAPRSKDEANEVMKIIRFFKQGMAPIRTGGHLFLRSPHTFQLAYMNRDQTHKYLNSFKECALKTCEVNYTPEQNYSTYEDGVMTAYTMSLQFQELEPVFNDDYGKKENVTNLNFKSDETSSSTGETSASSLTGGSDLSLMGDYL